MFYLRVFTFPKSLLREGTDETTKESNQGCVNTTEKKTYKMKKRNHLSYNPKLKQFPRNLRNNSTKAEVILWLQLKGKQMREYDFHRQKPIDNFIADFYCPRLELVIEVDGAYHYWEETIVKDQIKEAKLKSFGLSVLRFTNQDVLKSMKYVLRTIELYIDAYEERTHA